MREIPYILSSAYKKQIAEVCKPLLNLGINYFVLYIAFNDGSAFVLSNAHLILTPYYQETLFKEGTINSQTLFQSDEGYYLNKNIKSFSNYLSEIFAQKYNLFPVYHLVRKSSECTFVFSAVRAFPVDCEETFYKKTVKKFENFCVNFVDHFIDLIIQSNPNYRHAFILNSKSLRDAVIRQGYTKQPTITLREQECLWLASQGKSVKQIAQILAISPFTVEKYLKKIRESLQCNTLIEAIIEGIHRGLIGKLSPFMLKGIQRKSIEIKGNFARPAVINSAA